MYPVYKEQNYLDSDLDRNLDHDPEDVRSVIVKSQSS